MDQILFFYIFSGSLGYKNKKGNTALHLCSLLNRTECMKLILRTQPELASVENNNGHTPLDIAKENNYEICIDLVSVQLLGITELWFEINKQNVSGDKH